mmetsp:Transcript_157582/g.505382  ORF Transcript_157582/g.505382 Transcript_157582/m.505382 type:complete len:203 (+) Transcript_157582:310-918(+)
MTGSSASPEAPQASAAAAGAESNGLREGRSAAAAVAVDGALQPATSDASLSEPALCNGEGGTETSVNSSKSEGWKEPRLLVTCPNGQTTPASAASAHPFADADVDASMSHTSSSRNAAWLASKIADFETKAASKLPDGLLCQRRHSEPSLEHGQQRRHSEPSEQWRQPPLQLPLSKSRRRRSDSQLPLTPVGRRTCRLRSLP